MTETSDIPNCVEPDWSHSEDIGNPDGPSYRLLWWPSGRVGFEHTCDRGPRGVIICAPALQRGHTVTSTANGTTVNPSILCDDCDTHGFVRSGQWGAA